MNLRTVIVDDESLARDLLGLLLAEHHEVEVVAKLKNGRDVIRYLQENPADLLFLDVQMPEVGGFDVIEQVGVHRMPPTIFVTAYQEHAVRAFDVQAVDYLTKPVDGERLAIALDRVREKIAARSALLTQEQLTSLLSKLNEQVEEPKSHPTRFLVRDGDKEILLPVKEIEWIEAAAYYCCLHSRGRRYMLRETISDLSDRLDSRQFVRIHRSSIVNLDQIREIYREGQGDGTVALLSGQRLTMSKTGRQKLSALDRV